MTELTDRTLICQLQQSMDSSGLATLFDRYRPVLYRLQQTYYIPGFEQDDWIQEARLVLYTAVQKFQLERTTSFGAFYRLNLTHRIFDLIRQTQALKRQMNHTAVSIEAQSSYFADTLPDFRWALREQLEVKEAIWQLLPRLSVVERTVFVGILRGDSLELISQHQAPTYKQARSAAQRSQAKLRRLLAE